MKTWTTKNTFWAAIFVIGIVCVASVVSALAYLDIAGGATTNACETHSCTLPLSTITTTSTATTQTITTTTRTTQTTQTIQTTTIRTQTTIITNRTITTTRTVIATYRLGFWIDERDMWSGVGLNWTSQQFVTNYFLTAPYPSAMLFATAMTPTGPNAPSAIGEALWLSRVASLAQSQGLNVRIVILFFVNLSGGTINGVPDQTTLLTQYMSALGSHTNIAGCEYEREYYGNTVAEVAGFRTIINGAGYTNVVDPSMMSNFPSDPVLDYSSYPYFGGTIPSSLPSGSSSIGIGYGETGAPTGSTPTPAWTQTSVQAIVDTSPADPYVLVYAGAGYLPAGQPSTRMWNWPTLRNWIWTDSNYQQDFVLSTYG
ncbi:MAG: hypothetical protein OK438_00840 [Thaumarchaeota archaeon]|nr:hypothetical protein [Nitrososphaerota archaeon]